MSEIERVTTYGGNGQALNRELPQIVILAEHINEVALKHIEENTGLAFVRGHWSTYEAQPKTSDQIVRLLMTYNYKTRYFDNWDTKNTLMLKNDHHVGWDVSSICYECVKHNNLNTNGLNSGDRLAC